MEMFKYTLMKVHQNVQINVSYYLSIFHDEDEKFIKMSMNQMHKTYKLHPQ